MKHGLFQRSVSLLLALVMILGNVPMNALAAEGEETTAPACEHSYDAVTTDATCSQDGSVVYTCACGDTYTETIPATGEHAWGDWTVTAEATYEAAGLETRACGCGATEEREIPQLVAAHEHAWGDWTVAAEATYEAAGLETRTCECGETENREIPQLVKVKAELSGNTRKLYFLNTEAWEEVHVFWSFEEEDFEDVAFPGVTMEADEDLENVFVVELPVEADAVTFNDGVEVTEELKTYERENGIEAIHFFAAELSAELDYFSAAEQVEDENNATEWLSYEDVLAAWEAEIAEVQTMIDALPTAFATQEEVDAFWTSTEALDAAIEALTEAQQEKLDQSNYDAAIDAAAAFVNPEFEDATTLALSVAVGGTATLEKKDTSTVEYTELYNDSIATPSYWGEGAIRYRVKDSESWNKLTAASPKNINLEHGVTYEVQERYTRVISEKFSDSYYVTFKEYHNVTASMDTSANAEGAGKVTAPGKVYHNEQATIAVTDVDGYKAELYNGDVLATTLSDEAGWTYTIAKTDASADYTVKYVSEAATEYSASVTVVNKDNAAGEWGTASLNVDKGIAGAQLVLTVEPTAGSNSVKYTYEVAVANGSYDASTGKVAIEGTGDVAITVTFSKDELKATGNDAVKFNGYYADATALSNEQLAQLKADILAALGVQHNGADVAEATIEYYPYAIVEGTLDLLGNTGYTSDLVALNGQAKDDYDGWTGSVFYQNFGERGLGEDNKEKVRITVGSLYIDAEIVLTESRSAMNAIALSETSFTVNDLDALKAAVAAKVTVNGAAVTGATVELIGAEALTTEAKTYSAKITVPATAEYLESEKTMDVQAMVATYTVTWNVDGAKTTKSYAYGAAVEVPAAPEKEGYTFKEWTPAVNTTMGGESVEYTAVWQINTHKVTWNVEGEKTEVTCEYGATIAAPENPTKDGHTFQGWNGYTAGMSMPDKDVEFTASFTINNYDITFISHDYPNGMKLSVMYNVVPTNHKDYQIPADYVAGDLYYVFDKWEPAVAPATANATYRAVYTNDAIFKVTFDVNGGVLTEENIARVRDGETVAAKEATREGYRFDGWYQGEAAYDFTALVTEDITLTAKWVKLVTVSFDVEGIEEQTFDINGKAVKPADPAKDQAIFGGWYLGETEYDFATPVAENITLNAQWIADTNSNKVPDADETIQVTIVGNGAVNGKTESFTAVYDSVKEEKYALNIVPAMENGVSKSYVSSVQICGEEQTLTYHADYSVALAADKEKNEVLVTFADAGFTYDEDGEMRFYVGMEDPKYEALYNAVITAPEYNETAVKSVKYLARPAANYQMQVPVLFQYTVPVFNYTIKIGGNVVDIDLDDAWLDVGESFKTLTPEELQKQYDTEIQKIKDKIAGIDLSDWSNLEEKFKSISEELTTLTNTIKNEAQYLGYHQFGASGLVDENGNAQEKLQVIYENEAMRLVDENVYVTLVDDRMATVLTGGNVTVEYDEYTNADLLAAIQLTTEEGAAVDGAIDIAVDMSGKAVGTYTYTVTYAGSWDYKPATATFTLTVIKAPSSTDIVNQTVTYGSAYSAAPVITNKHGQTIDLDAIEFFLGLDVADMDVDGDGVKGLEGRMQLIPTKDLQTILAMVGLEEGAELNINQLISALTNTGLLEQWGVSSEMVEALKRVLDSINGVVETNNLMITIGGTYPTDIGAYLHGAVTMDANYETSFDVGYLIIKPDAQRAYLNWNYTDSNGIFTQQLLTSENLGASAYDDAAFTLRNETATAQVQNLFLGFNENGEVILELFAQNSDPNAIAQALGNGGYTQVAFVAELGNELYYAVPIARAFAIIPGVTKLDIIVDGQPSADLYKTVFDNAPVDVTVNGDVPEGSQVKVHYYGIEANTHTYDSDVAPTHTGAYAVTATLLARDGETGELTTVGLDVATIVIQPTESAITMKELQTVVFDGDYHNVADTMEIAASSNVENLKPDTTVITASIATDGSFSENGWAAVQGTVNVDFPRWMDELIGKYAPSVKDGITLSELEAKLLNKLPTITDKLEELGATNEMVNSTKNLLTNVSSLLEEMPADAVLSFKDDYEVLAVGTYAVAAVVTDSDHIPSVDAGLLVIVPDADQVFLDWDYHDENNIWSRELLSNVSINATAFNDKAFTEPNAQATAKITYQFIGLDQDAGLKIYTDPAQLPNGIYTQIAYIELEVDSQIVLSDIITRTIVIVPNMPELQIVDSRGAAQDKFEFTFDNEPVELYVNQNGTRIENEIRYIGLQTNGVEYDSTVAPVHAGAYAAITVLKTQENVGMDVALVTIAPAKSDISVTGGTVAYNGKKQTATVKAESPNSTVTSPDYTLISGTVDISAGVQNVGLESLCGDVNIDLPNWLDDVLAETEFNRVDADVASVAKFISTYRNDLLKLIPDQMLESAGLSTETVEAIMQKLNGGIDELLKVLDKLPDNVHLTFESNKGYTELGSYFYYGIVTDSDHIPAADTGLLVIVPATITADDVEVTSQHVYNGKEQTVTVEIKVGDKILEAGRDYEVTGNTATNAGEYVMTVIGKGNYAGELSVEWSIEKAPVEVTLSDMTKTYGDGDPTLTYTVKGLTDGDSAANLNIAATRKPGENVGTYVITATAENANYNITIINGTFTITKANAMVADAPAVKELTYTGEDQLLVDAGRSNDGKLMYSLDQNGEYTENIPTGKDANEYTVWYYVAGDANHEDSAKQSVKVIIKSKSITDVAVSLDGKPTFNGTAYVQNVIVKDGEYVLNLNDYEIIGNTATGAGKYTLTVKGKGNYAGEVKIEWSFGDGYPIYFQSGDANGMIHAETTVFVDDVAYVLDENCVAWAADKNRELAIGYVYKNSGNHITDYAHSDTTKNMYIWDLQWNEETKSYKADRVEELDNLLSFAGGSIWLGSDGVNGIRTYYSTTADTEAVKGAFRNLGYEVVTHGIVVGWADKLNGSEPVPNGNNSASGHAVGNGTFYDEIYPAADKYITPDLRARFYVELKNIETSESKIIYSGSVERSIGYIAYQNIGRVDAQYQPYVKAILDKAAAAGYTYGNY